MSVLLYVFASLFVWVSYIRHLKAGEVEIQQKH